MKRAVAFALALCLPPVAGSAQSRAGGLPGEAAFIEHRLTLQVSDSGEEKQRLILSNANNVLKAYGPDKVAIEVVAFGPGVDLLRAGNPNAERISSLVAQGVVFDICMNTVSTIERTSGRPFPINPQARPVDAGVVQIITLAEHGYTTVHP